MDESKDNLWSGFGKRIFDIVVALLILPAILPVCVIVALLIKLTSPGPLFFIQDRSGRNGDVFRLPKFRTMSASRKPDPKELVPLHHPDITRIGKVLRRLKIDEFPQLICIFSGRMSLVGPRPTLPDQTAAYDDFRRKRLQVRPGLTGLAQVFSSAEASWEERILYDIAYVKKLKRATFTGLTLDISILFRTVRVVATGEQARPFRESPYAELVTAPQGYYGGSK